MIGWDVPPGVTLGGRTELVEHRCKNEECGHVWEAVMHTELGGWFYSHDDADGDCPECGAEGEPQ